MAAVCFVLVHLVTLLVPKFPTLRGPSLPLHTFSTVTIQRQELLPFMVMNLLKLDGLWLDVQ